jgi:pimeloyl-ACP methyl ester carboxylesterase
MLDGMTDAQEIWIGTPNGRLFAKAWTAEGVARPPFVLFHDSLGCVDLWREFPAELARATGRSVIAYDRLGFGRSDAHPGRLRVSFVHDEAHEGFSALRDQLQIESFIAFGHSVGGGMAVGVAGAFPTRCHALVTESAQAFAEDRTLQGIRDAKQAFAQPGQLDCLRKYHGDKAEWVLNAWTNTWLSADFASWSLDADLPRVRCPVLVIHGDTDEYGSVRHPQRIGSLTSGPARVEILPDCGHVPHREQEGVVLNMIRAFVEQGSG